MYPTTHQYTRLPQPQPPKKPPSRLRLVCLCVLPLLAIAAIVWTALSSHLGTVHGPTSPRWSNCGSSPTEARARGCRFDILSFAWQTPECFDGELMDDFVAFDNWTFYSRFNDTTETVSLEEALRGDRGLFVNWRYHVAHCTFMWRQMHRAYARGYYYPCSYYIDSHLDSYAHTMHCQQTLLDRDTSMDSVVVVGALRYPECKKVGQLQAPLEMDQGAVESGMDGVYSL